MSALFRFVETNHDIKKLRRLIRGRKNPNIKDRFQQTLLHIAIIRCELNLEFTNEILLVVRELIKFGVDVDEGEASDMTPLHLAVLYQNYKMIEVLLQANADINKKECVGWSALHFATKDTYSPELDIVKLLLKYKPDVNIQTKNNETPLMFAVQANDLYIVLELLKKEPSVTILDNSWGTAMHYALRQPEVNVKIVLELAKRGCSFNTENVFEFTARQLYFFGLSKIENSEKIRREIEVIKLFVLDGHILSYEESESVQRFESKNNKFIFFRNFYLFHDIIKKMRKDELAPNCTVYDIAYRGAFHRTNANDERFTVAAFDAVFNRLMSGEYLEYCDLILSGICSSYLDRKFAGLLSYTVSDIKIIEYDLFMLISKYLEKVDKLNMMIVCCKEIGL